MSLFERQRERGSASVRLLMASFVKVDFALSD
jgi:hypothetical protein